jgi:predicted transcriptional regulator
MTGTRVQTEKTRINLDLGDSDLLRRLKFAATENEMTLTEIAVEALTYWLAHQEEVEDELARQKLARVAAESSGEYIPHDEVKRRLHGSALSRPPEPAH